MKLKVTIDGKIYEVDVEVPEPEQPRPTYIPPSAATTQVPAKISAVPGALPASQKPAADENKVCRSPMAGVVVRVTGQVGQQIQANDVLLVLEAMKMETTVTAPNGGKIGKVNVKVGDPVQKGQILFELE